MIFSDSPSSRRQHPSLQLCWAVVAAIWFHVLLFSPPPQQQEGKSNSLFFFFAHAFSHATPPSSSSSGKVPSFFDADQRRIASSEDESKASSVVSDESSSLSSAENIRPIYQNWWPVSLVSSLDPSRPNAIELLEKRLVLWKSSQDDDDDDGSGGWTCLDDACAHRFAPLSEGRIVRHDHEEKGEETSDETKTTRTLQCAYHGWEFTNNGSCSRIPQATADSAFLNSPSCQVRSYPAKIGGGMVWVWSDPNPSTFALAKSIKLPISPLLDRSVSARGSSFIFQRDLPYGAELLGENLLDLSHLPFSHHTGTTMRREQGGPVPLRMLNLEEKKEKMTWEGDYHWRNDTKKKMIDDKSNDDDDGGDPRLPMFQAEVVNASLHDPILFGLATNDKVPIPDDAQCTAAFYDPCHIRYRRIRGNIATNIELFLCPTSAGKSRVFLSQLSERFPPPRSIMMMGQNQSPQTMRMKKRLSLLKQQTKKKKKIPLIKQQIMRFIISKWVGNPLVIGHMMAHFIFDGDGIFLHKQGDRMAQRNLTFKDYFTPTSADVLVNAFRRYFDGAAKCAVQSGTVEGMAAAYAVGGCSSYSSPTDTEVNGDSGAMLMTTQKPYLDNEARSILLDRYTSHTKQCRICSLALEKYEQREQTMDIAFSAFLGTGGVSGMMIALALTLGIGGGGTAVAISKQVLKASALILVTSITGALGSARARRNANRRIQQFRFVDYVHTEKN